MLTSPGLLDWQELLSTEGRSSLGAWELPDAMEYLSKMLRRYDALESLDVKMEDLSTNQSLKYFVWKVLLLFLLRKHQHMKKTTVTTLNTTKKESARSKYSPGRSNLSGLVQMINPSQQQGFLMVMSTSGQLTSLVSQISSQSDLGTMSMKASIKMPLIDSQSILYWELALQMRQDMYYEDVPRSQILKGYHFPLHCGPVQVQSWRQPVMMVTLVLEFSAYISQRRTVSIFCWHQTAKKMIQVSEPGARIIYGLKRSICQQLANLAKDSWFQVMINPVAKSTTTWMYPLGQLRMILGCVSDPQTILTFEQAKPNCY